MPTGKPCRTSIFYQIGNRPTITCPNLLGGEQVEGEGIRLDNPCRLRIWHGLLGQICCDLAQFNPHRQITLPSRQGFSKSSCKPLGEK